MRKTFLFFLILPLALFAAEGSEIDAALNKIGEKMKDLKTFTADFKQLDKDPLFMDESEHSGKLSFLRSVKDSTVMRPVTRLTSASCTPGTARTAFATWA